MTDYLHILLIAIFWIFAAAAIIQLFYYLYFYLATIKWQAAAANSKLPPVSVIICARNEAENLKNFLPVVLEQDYPDFEVIVVNDCSEDETYEILGNYLLKYPNLKISTVTKDPKFTHFKKFAQFIGIKAAKNEVLLFTDADCVPVSEKWIEQMVSHFDSNTSFVLGYGGYMNKKGLLNKYIRYDSLTIAIQYLGMAIRGVPYMGVGRNLAYRRSLFFEKKGFGSFNHIVSGDDDLFVNSHATMKNTRVEFRPDSITQSIPAITLNEWTNQKKRHLTTAPYYRFSHKVLLFLEPFSRVLFYSLFIVLCATLTLLPYTLGIFGLRLIIQSVIFIIAAKKFRERGLFLYSIFFDIFSPLINMVLFFRGKDKKPQSYIWK